MTTPFEPAVPGYYTIPELAAACGKTESAVRYHCTTGRLRGVARSTGRDWLIPDGAGNRFIAGLPIEVTG